FVLDQGRYTTLDVPGSTYTAANGINASGQISGVYGIVGNYLLLGPGNRHSFVLDHGSYTPLDVPGSYDTSARGINDEGQIVGTYGDAGGTHGFLATPVP